MVYQVKELFDDVKAIGDSRHAAKQEAVIRGEQPQAMLPTIHSWGTYKREMQGAIQFTKWCKAEYGIKYLTQIKPDMTRCYMESRQDKAANTRAADLTAIRRLDKCLQARYPSWASIVPQDVKAPRQVTPRGAYEPAQAQAIIKRVSRLDPQSGQVLRLQLAGGLRVREAVWLHRDFIDVRCGKVAIAVQVKGKGGKPRVVEIDRRLLSRLDLSSPFPLRALRQQGSGWIKDKTQIKRIEDLVKAVCRTLGIQCRGTHGLRATAAISYYKLLVIQGLSKIQALSRTAEWLGHGPRRWDVLRHYFGGLVDEALKEAQAS